MTHEEIAEKLLYPIWRSITDEFKDRYKADAWNIYENFIKTAACNPTLSLFYDKLKRLLPIDVKIKYEKELLSALSSNKDEEVLNLLRTETGYLVLLTRALNNERKNINYENSNS